MRVYIPPMKPIHKDATFEERQKAYEAYRKELLEMNLWFKDGGGWMHFILAAISVGLIAGLALAYIALRGN